MINKARMAAIKHRLVCKDPSDRDWFRQVVLVLSGSDEDLGLCSHINWSKEVGISCNSFQRMPALMELYLSCLKAHQRNVFFRCLGDSWSICDNIGVFIHRLKYIFNFSTRRHLHLMMTADEKAEWSHLPDKITAFRGAYDLNLSGFSYSLTREVAIKFPRYSRYHRPGDQGFVVKGEIPKEHAVLKLDRSEVEIIATRPERVLVIKKEALP